MECFATCNHQGLDIVIVETTEPTSTTTPTETTGATTVTEPQTDIAIIVLMVGVSIAVIGIIKIVLKRKR